LGESGEFVLVAIRTGEEVLRGISGGETVLMGVREGERVSSCRSNQYDMPSTNANLSRTRRQVWYKETPRAAVLLEEVAEVASGVLVVDMTSMEEGLP
jgi:hypothetical protein